MSDASSTPDTIENLAEPLLVDQLVEKLYAIDLESLDVEREMVALNQANDWRFVVIPVTVLLLMTGMAIGLYMESMIVGFIIGALLALTAGYAYHLWDKQWREVAVNNVLTRINNLEGKDGFLHWFRPLLAKNTYKAMFYKLYKQQVVDISMYLRAVKRLREKPQTLMRDALIAAHPQLAPVQAEEDSEETEDVITLPTIQLDLGSDAPTA
jgi:hypothetical protein